MEMRGSEGHLRQESRHAAGCTMGPYCSKSDGVTCRRSSSDVWQRNENPRNWVNGSQGRGADRHIGSADSTSEINSPLFLITDHNGESQGGPVQSQGSGQTETLDSPPRQAQSRGFAMSRRGMQI
jgi:hypothetical protein